MELKLTHFNYSKALSQETCAYSANVHVNGILAFHATNDGHGGLDVITPIGTQGAALLQQAKDWALAQPYVSHPDLPTPSPSNLDMQMAILVFNTIRIRWEKRACRTKTVIQEEGCHSVYVEYKRPYSNDMRKFVEQEHPNCRIVNEEYKD